MILSMLACVRLAWKCQYFLFSKKKKKSLSVWSFSKIISNCLDQLQARRSALLIADDFFDVDVCSIGVKMSILFIFKKIISKCLIIFKKIIFKRLDQLQAVMETSIMIWWLVSVISVYLLSVIKYWLIFVKLNIWLKAIVLLLPNSN